MEGLKWISNESLKKIVLNVNTYNIIETDYIYNTSVI